MSLDYILRRFCQKSGLSRDTEADKQICIDYIQEAAKELYEASDLYGCIDEVVLAVNDRSTISLPSFIGIPRAMRQVDLERSFRLSSIRPRYHNSNWSQESYMNWRDKGYSPLAVDLTNTAPPKVIVPAVDCGDISVTIVGSTSKSSRVVETKVITELETQFETSFLTIEVIKKDKISTYDVIIVDANDNELSIIYSNELQAQFRIIDVSNYPYSGTDQSIGMEVLYKKRLLTFSKDTDEFPIQGYDDVIIAKAVQLRLEDAGNAEGAVLYDKKAERTARRIADDQTKGKDIRIETIRHRHDNVFSNLRRRMFNTNYPR